MSLFILYRKIYGLNVQYNINISNILFFMILSLKLIFKT